MRISVFVIEVVRTLDELYNVRCSLRTVLVRSRNNEPRLCRPPPHGMLQHLQSICTPHTSQACNGCRIPIPTRKGHFNCRARTSPSSPSPSVGCHPTGHQVTKWIAEDRPNTITFIPMDVDYNLLRLQSMPSSIYLTHPEDPIKPSRYLVRPP